MVGQTISHYQIIEKLGEGGMGVVYKALDTKLDRLVALKFLPSHLEANDEEKQRFIIEARAASALDHPNIGTIYEINETAEGQMFIAMAFYEGETLKKKVSSNQLPVNSVIDIAIQIAQGLAKAHQHGIIHRDIKPANVIITTEGTVKIVDFGLVKFIGKSRFTKTGSALGTTAYMSPEQARGEQVDGRSDIWSFGVVMYELLSGQLPFPGEYDAAIIYGIINEPFQPISRLRSDVPQELESIINKCLEKDTAGRYQDVDDVFVELRRLKRGSESKEISIEKGKEHRRLAAIMFTDMVGYSALTQKNEELALKLLDEHRRLLRPLFSKYGGKEIEATGDAFFVEFSSALQAARCAIEIQKILHERNASVPADRYITIRIGLHLGDVVHTGEHVHGDGVNIAARLEPLAEPGGICVSEDVARQIKNKIDRPLVGLGKGQLKNIQLPVRIYRFLMPWETKGQDWRERLISFLRQKRTLRYGLIVLAIALITGLSLVLAPETARLDRKSIAVLPFTNLSDTKEDEYFSDGITEDIITRLSKIRDLKVISRTSSMHYKNSDKSLPEIGKELKIATVLEGSVRRTGNRVRIASQLIDARSDEHLWAETYDRDMRDIFEIQSEVAQKIATALEAELVPDEKAQLARKETENLQAYSSYLKGRYFWNKRTPDNVLKGLQFFEQAIAEDPSYALAYAGIADAYNALGSIEYGILSPHETAPKAEAAAQRALQLDPALVEAHVALANIEFNYKWNWPAAEEIYKRVIESNPGYAPAYHVYSHLLCATGRLEAALAEERRALELDPLSLIINTQVGMCLYYLRRYDQAIEQHRKTIELDQTFLQARLALGMAYERSGNADAAIAEFEKALSLAPGLPVAEALLAYAYAVAGRTAEAMKLLAGFERPEKRRFISPFHMAVVHLGLGNKDQVFAWLNKASEEHSSYLVFFKVEPLLDDVRSDPRFIALLRKMGIEK